MEVININIPSSISDFKDDHYKSIKIELEKRSATLEKCLFQHELTAEEWKIVEEYAKKLNVDYSQRAELMLKRLDVTVDSFLWSDRIQKLEEQVLNAYLPVRNALKIPPPVEIEDLIAASTNLLIVEKASSRQIRQTTCNEFNAYIVNERPLDRGGRTSEMMAPQDDNPYQKNSSWNKKKHSDEDSKKINEGGRFVPQFTNQLKDNNENQVKSRRGKYSSSGSGRGGEKRKFQPQ